MPGHPTLREPPDRFADDAAGDWLRRIHRCDASLWNLLSILAGGSRRGQSCSALCPRDADRIKGAARRTKNRRIFSYSIGLFADRRESRDAAILPRFHVVFGHSTIRSVPRTAGPAETSIAAPYRPAIDRRHARPRHLFDHVAMRRAAISPAPCPGAVALLAAARRREIVAAIHQRSAAALAQGSAAGATSAYRSRERQYRLGEWRSTTIILLRRWPPGGRGKRSGPVKVGSEAVGSRGGLDREPRQLMGLAHVCLDFGNSRQCGDRCFPICPVWSGWRLDSARGCGAARST